MKLFANRRGISLMLEAFIGFVLAVFAMVILVYVGFRLAAIFFPSTIDPATEANMNNLAKTINLLSSENKEKDAIRYFPFHIGTKYILVGFPRGQWVMDDCAMLGARQINFPQECSDKACLCLYDDIGKAPLKCISLPGVDLLYSSYHVDEERMRFRSGLSSEVTDNLRAAPLLPKPRAYGGWSGQYQYFIVHGKCMLNSAFGVQELYIDMHHDDGKTYIFIAGESGNTQDRYNDLQQELSGFPKTIDEQLDELISIIKNSKNPFDVRNAIFTVLTSQELVDRFISTHSLDEFKKLFFKRYEPSQVPIPSVNEISIKQNAEKIWEQYEAVLIKLGYPGKPWYVSACVSAFKSGNVDNECWIPKHMTL